MCMNLLQQQVVGQVPGSTAHDDLQSELSWAPQSKVEALPQTEPQKPKAWIIDG